MQDPAEGRTSFATEVLRFVDGSEQRFRKSGKPVRRWVVRLDLLDEGEMKQLEVFFRAMQGALGSFRFLDPETGMLHSNCSLDQDKMGIVFQAEQRAGTTLVVRENRS